MIFETFSNRKILNRESSGITVAIVGFAVLGGLIAGTTALSNQYRPSSDVRSVSSNRSGTTDTAKITEKPATKTTTESQMSDQELYQYMLTAQQEADRQYYAGLDKPNAPSAPIKNESPTSQAPSAQSPANTAYRLNTYDEHENDKKERKDDSGRHGDYESRDD